jgi:hypothetical protein
MISNLRFAFLIAFLGAAVACQKPVKPGVAPAPFPSDSLKQEGRAITTRLADSLLLRVKTARAEGGVSRAVDVCKIEAAGIHAAVSSRFNVSIKRTALKVRNPLNAPDSLELALLRYFEQQRSSGALLTDTVIAAPTGPRYFRPIVLLDACRACHGNPETEITPADLAVIRAAYPDDQATGFAPGDVRGLFSVRF